MASIIILCIVPIINDQKCRFANDRCVTFQRRNKYCNGIIDVYRIISQFCRRWNQNNNICYFNFVLLLILIILVTKQVLKFSTEKYIMDVQRSFAVFTMASLITFISMIIISATEQGKLSFYKFSLK